MPDMFAKISAMDLAVLEIKLLAQINGENSPKQLVPVMGLPLTEIYRMLTRFAKAGVVIAPGGLESLPEDSLGVEASMQLAFDALDANDDEGMVSSALDKVLGGVGEATGKIGIELLDVKKKKRG